jgi:hypothetical protein
MHIYFAAAEANANQHGRPARRVQCNEHALPGRGAPGCVCAAGTPTSQGPQRLGFPEATAGGGHRDGDMVPRRFQLPVLAARICCFREII